MATMGRRKLTPRTCQYSKCGREFESFKKNAKFCSDNCRIRAHLDGKPYHSARDLVLQRDGNACTRCGRTNNVIVRFTDKNNPSVDTGTTLCRRCAYGKTA